MGFCYTHTSVYRDIIEIYNFFYFYHVSGIHKQKLSVTYLSRPPFSNSWADIFRTGVAAPDPELVGLFVVDDVSCTMPWGAEWDSSQESTM